MCFGDGDCVYTIGCGGKSAQAFFGLLAAAGVERVIDVRLYNTSQLAGFSKRDDLAYFLEAVLGVEYLHVPTLAPTREILADYKNGIIDWTRYECAFGELIALRGIETLIDRRKLGNCCFLCVEAKARYCHRRLVAEYLVNHWGGFEIVHL